jgi:protein arginine kinase
LEKKARDTLFSQNPLEMEDQVFRALGILKNARKMSYGEFISLYSRVRLGREAQMAGMEQTAVLDRLFVELMPAPMILRDASLSGEAARDEERSRILREKLNQTE